MTRLVVDASVLVSAAVAFPESRPTRLLEAARAGEVELVVCEQLLGEIDRALQSRYFASRLTVEERSAFLGLLRAIGLVADDPVAPPPVLRDPGDDYLVALAADTNAEAIVTSDGDLLEHAGLVPPAIAVREACQRLGLTDD